MYHNSTSLPHSSLPPDSIACRDTWAMAETRARGRPSKKPRLVQHSLPIAGTDTSSHYVQCHRNFTVEATGQINLWTTYLDGAATSVENPELKLVTNLEDPWNESHDDTGLLSDAAPHNDMVGNARQRQTAGVS